MIYEALLFLASAALLATLGLVVHNFIVCQLTYLNFKKKSKNLPLFSDRKLLGNHITTWPARKNLCNELVKQHERLGKTVGMLLNHRYGASTVDLDLIKLFIYDEPNKHINRMRVGTPLKEIEESITMLEDDAWRKVRRNFAPALKKSSFTTPNVIGEIEMSIKKLTDKIELELESSLDAANIEKELEIDELIHRYSLNLVFSCFYKQYNLIDFNDENCKWTKLVDQGFDACQTSSFIHMAGVFPVLNPVIDWLSWHFHPIGVWRQSVMNFVKTQAKLGLEARKQAQEILKNKKQGEKINLDNFVMKDGTTFRRNMIDNVIDRFLDGKLTKSEFFNTSWFLVGAADKTASDTIVHTLYLLGRHQAVQDKLRDAIRCDGMDAEYLAWVINEALRLQPPAPIGCTRTITRDIELDSGHVLPANTFVITPAYAIHRLKEYWGEDADEFRPERWQDTSHFHPMQYIPFGAGIRGCPGKEFALFEIKMLFTTLLTRYKFECRHKDDMYTFDSPVMIFLIPNSHTSITIKKLV